MSPSHLQLLANYRALAVAGNWLHNRFKAPPSVAAHRGTDTFAEEGWLPVQTTLTLHGSKAGSMPKQPRGHSVSFSCFNEVEENIHPVK